MLSAREWLTIAIFLLTAVLTVVGFLLKRFINRVDAHEEAIHGKGGLFALLGQYVKREVHDVANAELAAQMDRMRLEGIQRENRIIEAIEREGDRATQENRITRTDLAKLHERIDRIRDSRRQ